MFAKVKPNTRIIGQNIIYFNRTPSTNSFALELMKQNMAEHGSVICAEFQTGGRGQSGKFWISDAFENLLFSVILKPVTSYDHYPFSLNKAITLAVLTALKKFMPHKTIQIKWPNDILLESGKICGILMENNFSGQKLKWSIAGIGININQNFDLHPGLNAVSMRSICGGDDISREKVLESVLESIENYYTLLEAGENEAIQNEFDSMLLGYGKMQTFTSEGKSIQAVIRGCDKEGRLLLETPDAKIKPYIHGSIKQEIIYAERGN